MSATEKKIPDAPYAMDERVFPSESDDDLWKTVYQMILHDYGQERVMLEHVRWAFSTVCQECDDYLLVKDFVRKVRLKWLWKRPPLPRGLVDF